MKNKNFNWRPMSEYTGGCVLATNDLDVLIGEINSDGDCESKEDGSTVLCGITGFVKIEEILPKIKESEDERIRKEMLQIAKESEDAFYMTMTPNKRKTLIAWLERQGNLMKALQISNAKIGELIEKNYYLKEQLEKQRKNNMGISEATKQKLEDNLHKALEKETPESWNKFLDEQGEQKMKTPEESLGIDSDTYNKIVDECIYGEQKPTWSGEVDLEKEIQMFSSYLAMKENNGDWEKDIAVTAKHFFELGMAVSNKT